MNAPPTFTIQSLNLVQDLPLGGQSTAQVDTAATETSLSASRRMRLTDTVLSALCSDFEANGAWAIERMRLEEPALYVRLMVSLLPAAFVKQFEQRRLSEASQMPIEQLNEYGNAKFVEQAVSTISENPGSFARLSR